MKCRLPLLLPLVLLILPPAGLSAGTIRVPADYPTIQGGIDASVDGDTVLVIDGVYTGAGNKNLDFAGRAIVVMSESGHTLTTIDCQGSGRAFRFHTAEGPLSVVRGFKIANGKKPGGWGGGIFCDEASPTIQECLFVNNFAENGGGIACDDNATPVIEDCVFYRGTGTDYGGGIILDDGCHATITRCVFSENEGGTGGAIRCGAASPIISECLLVRNEAETDGGGMELRLHSDPIITHCVIAGNHAGGRGGGIKLSELADPVVTRCLIKGNTAEGLGGGVMARNQAAPVFVNCTIGGNTTYSGQGGGVAVDLSANPVFRNSILWNNEPGEVDVVTGTASITYSDVEGGWSGVGNIGEDPLFVGGDPFDYHLTADSPCIDAGDPADQLDPDGTRADMGVFPFNQSGLITLSVVPDTTYYQRGDSLGFTPFAVNGTDSTVMLQGWAETETPWGEVVTPVLGPIWFYLGPGETVSPHIAQWIPMYVPFGGPYIYTVAIGQYPDDVIAEDSFPVYIVPGRDDGNEPRAGGASTTFLD